MNFFNLKKNRFKRFLTIISLNSALFISIKTYNFILRLTLTTRYDFSYLKVCLFKLIIFFSRIELYSKINLSTIIGLN
jgi:hypothetical protein